MKRYEILIASALIATAGAAAAGMNPNGIFGLPKSWSTTSSQGYGTHAATVGNGASSMCVECHTVNPSGFIRDVSDIGAVTVLRTNAAHKGSHFVINALAGGGTNPWGITNSGGGFSGGYNAPRDTGNYFRRGTTGTGTNWTSGATSKYGNGTALTSVYEGGTGFGVGTADMICESCHNVVTNALGANAGGTADNDLLVGAYQDNVNDAICTGCHAQSEVAAGRQAFHSNDNLKSFDGLQRKKHHVMTGDTLNDTDYKAGTDSIMWAPSASNRLDNGWCSAPYSKLSPTVSLNLATGAAISYRDACNVAGQGTRAVAAAKTLGDVVPVEAGSNLINCSNCHRPHNAMSTSGAFIFRYGDTSKPDFVGAVGTGAFSGKTNADLEYGIRRQSDVDSTYASKIYTDYRPLCAGCHYGY